MGYYILEITFNKKTIQTIYIIYNLITHTLKIYVLGDILKR